MKCKMAREDFKKSKELLLKLHEMVAQGTDQTDEADVLRDSMDLPARGLSPLEFTRLKGLAGDLYMLNGEEVKVKTGQPYRHEEFCANQAVKNWDEILSILRKSNFPGPEEGVALLRGMCWFEIGEIDVALLFIEHAEKLQPSNLTIRALALLYRVILGLNFDPQKLERVLGDLGYTERDRNKQPDILRRHFNAHHPWESTSLLQSA